jgi:hypothetical protein
MASGSSTTTDTTSQNRLRIFANAFKNYMGVMPVVTAALAPLLTLLKAVPTYESQRTTLATLSGILGFLLLAWLFYIRRTIALGSLTRGFRFLINTIPLLLIVITVFCFLWYFKILGSSTAEALKEAGQGRWTYVEKDKVSEFKTESDVLKHWDDRAIPNLILLQVVYLGIFLSAESAFVMMALREYINDTRRVSELEWMFGKQDAQWLKQVQERIQARLQSES